MFYYLLNYPFHSYSLPGSPKGAKENLESILKVLPHALDLATGGSGKLVHAALGSVRENGNGTKQKDVDVLLATAVVPSIPNLVGDHQPHQHHHHQHHHSHAGGHVAPQSRTALSKDPSIAGKKISVKNYA